ncbi:MAG: glycosyltransferase family 39 protein, partial [Chloroflexota bacterium]
VAVDSFALLFLFLIARRLFSTRVAVWAGVFFLINPFIFFYDRIALADGPLMTLFALACWLALRVADGRQPLRSGLALGAAIGLAILTKLSGVLVWSVPLLAIVSAADWRGALRQWRAWLLAWFAAALLYAPAWVVGAGQYQLGAKSVLAMEPDEIAAQLGANLALLVEWLSGYSPGLLGLLIVTALLVALRLKRRSIMWVVGALLPMAFFVVVSRVWYPRYVLFAFIPLALLCGLLLAQVAQWVMRAPRTVAVGALALGLAAIFAPSLYFDYTIATDPPSAPFPSIERWQYVADWPAGYGVAGAAAYLHEAAAQSEDGIHVMRHNRSSPVLEALELYLRDDPKITLHSMNLTFDNTPNRLTALFKQKPTYVVLDPPREGYDFQERYPLAYPRARFPKPGDQSAIVIYQW